MLSMAPGRTGSFEVTVNDGQKTLHSKLSGQGHVRPDTHVPKIMEGIQAALNA